MHREQFYKFLCRFSACLCFSATKKRMQTVANISILAMFVMYLLTALFGYLTFFGKTPSLAFFSVVNDTSTPCDICQRAFAPLLAGAVESELLHTYSRVDPLDVLILCVRLAVLVAVTLTVPVVLFPVRNPSYEFKQQQSFQNPELSLV